MQGFKPVAVAMLLAALYSGTVVSAMAQTACTPGSDFAASGASAFSAGDYALALTSFGCAIAENPSNYELYADRMRAALLAGRYAQAVADANALRDFARPVFETELQAVSFEISANPSDVGNLMVRALLFWADARDFDALADCEQILALDPNNAFAYLFRGSSNQYLGDRLTPADDFADAIQLSGQSADVYALIGSTYAQTGDQNQAMMNLNQAIQRDPSNPRSHYFLGMVFLDQNRYPQAIEYFTTAVSLDPNYADAYYDRGRARALANDSASAVADFTQAITINPSYRLAYLSRAIVQETSGDTTASLADYIRYVELNQIAQIDGEPLFSDLPVIADMDDGRVYHYPLVVEPGQTVTITAQSANNRSDPLLILLAPDGTPLAANDDQVIGQFTSVIDGVPITASGAHTVVLTHSDGGFSGRIDLTVQIR